MTTDIFLDTIKGIVATWMLWIEGLGIVSLCVCVKAMGLNGTGNLAVVLEGNAVVINKPAGVW